jgi:hypothetical protein
MEKAIRYEVRAPFVATGREMKALLALVLVVLAAASAFAFNQVEVVSGVSLAMREWPLSEPGTMLLSGSGLLVLAGLLRRLGG